MILQLTPFISDVCVLPRYCFLLCDKSNCESGAIYAILLLAWHILD